MFKARYIFKGFGVVGAGFQEGCSTKNIFLNTFVEGR